MVLGSGQGLGWTGREFLGSAPALGAVRPMGFTGFGAGLGGENGGTARGGIDAAGLGDDAAGAGERFQHHPPELVYA